MMIEFKDSKHLMDIQHKKKNDQACRSRAAGQVTYPKARRLTSSVLFSKGRRTERFFTEDSGLYITPRQKKMMDAGYVLQNKAQRWDSLSSRIVKKYQAYRPSQTDVLYQMLIKRYEMLCEDARQASKSFVGQFSMAQLWNVSMVGAILLGMVSMSMIYRFLGPGASAETPTNAIQPADQVVASTPAVSASAASVLGAATANDAGQIDALPASSTVDESDFNKRAKAMVKGYPIEDMLPYILNKDKTVAAFMIGIARKESSWGQHVPVLNGQDCYNYWGYRQQRLLMGSDGHTCFNSRKDAVDTVAKRIKTLVDGGRKTPAEMILWKCGDGCVGDADELKWISDVNTPFRELMK